MRRVLLAAIASAALLLPLAAADAREFPPPVPFGSIELTQLGYATTTLRGDQVGTDFFIPGPADFLLGTSSFLDLDLIPSQLLAKESTMVVLWNGVPVHNRQIGGGTGLPEHVVIPIPVQLIDPETNRLEFQAQLRLVTDTCDIAVDSPARNVTILGTTRIRYSFADPRVPKPAAVTADLAKYPLPFFSATHPQPAPVRFVIPDRPTPAELTALGRVAVQLGQYAGFRGIKVELQRSSDVRESDLDRTHTILVGKESSLPLLLRLTNAPLRQDRDGRFLDEKSKPVADDSGVVMTMPAPWSAARGVLVVSGRSDDAVAKAGLALSGRDGIGALRGAYAIVPDLTSYTPPVAVAAAIRLSDLGRTDEQINNGVGERSITFTVFLPAVAKDAAVPFDVAVSHSGLLDQNRSSLRVLVNDVALESIALREIPPVHGVHRFELPGSSLRPGANTMKVEFSLRLPGFERGQCAALPLEQAWVVLHADSAFLPPTAAGKSGAEPDLSTYPYPFQRSGSLDETLVVVPDDLGANPQALVQLLAEIGRGTRSTLQRPAVIAASQFDPARDAKARDVVLFGLPADDPVLADLGGRLPVEVGPDRRLVLSRDLTIRVEDLERLGVVEETASPWAADRAVMVVTGTSAEGLDLAVEAIRQRNMSGNVVLASHQAPRPRPAGASPTPEPLQYGGPATIPLDVSAYVRRPAILAAQQEFKPPWALIAAAVIALIALIVAAAEAYEAFRTGEDAS